MTESVGLKTASVAELKSCPWCQQRPTIRFVGDEDGGYHEVSCYTPHDEHAELFCGVHASEEALAIAAWNRRPTPSNKAVLREVYQLCLSGDFYQDHDRATEMLGKMRCALLDLAGDQT